MRRGDFFNLYGAQRGEGVGDGEVGVGGDSDDGGDGGAAAGQRRLRSAAAL